MTIQIDSSLELKLLKLSDSADIFNTINSQREYLGKWLPFVAYTQELKDTENFVNSILNSPEEKFEYTFTIRKQNQFIGLIGLKDSDKTNRITEIGYWLSEKFQNRGTYNYWDVFLLGVLFALAFCPYSGVLYFGMLVPLTISTSGLHLPVVFAVATGIPVILFAWLIAYTISGVGGFYKKIKAFEYWFRRLLAILFIGIGIYYIVTVWF